MARTKRTRNQSSEWTEEAVEELVAAVLKFYEEQPESNKNAKIPWKKIATELKTDTSNESRERLRNKWNSIKNNYAKNIKRGRPSPILTGSTISKELCVPPGYSDIEHKQNTIAYENCFNVEDARFEAWCSALNLIPPRLKLLQPPVQPTPPQQQVTTLEADAANSTTTTPVPTTAAPLNAPTSQASISVQMAANRAAQDKITRRFVLGPGQSHISYREELRNVDKDRIEAAKTQISDITDNAHIYKIVMKEIADRSKETYEMHCEWYKEQAATAAELRQLRQRINALISTLSPQPPSSDA